MIPRLHTTTHVFFEQPKLRCRKLGLRKTLTKRKLRKALYIRLLDSVLKHGLRWLVRACGAEIRHISRSRPMSYPQLSKNSTALLINELINLSVRIVKGYTARRIIIILLFSITLESILQFRTMRSSTLLSERA